MINSAIRELRLDVRRCALLGDKDTDLVAGRMAGIRNTYLMPNSADSSLGLNNRSRRNDHVINGLFVDIARDWLGLQYNSRYS